MVLHSRNCRIPPSLVDRRPTTNPEFPSWRFRLFSGFRSQVKATAVEVDCVNEVLLVPETSCCVLDPLDLGIDRFAGGVGDAVPQVRDDVLEPPFEHPCHLDHRLQPTPHCPVVPPTEVLSGRTFVDVAV